MQRRVSLTNTTRSIDVALRIYSTTALSTVVSTTSMSTVGYTTSMLPEMNREDLTTPALALSLLLLGRILRRRLTH